MLFVDTIPPRRAPVLRTPNKSRTRLGNVEYGSSYVPPQKEETSTSKIT